MEANPQRINFDYSGTRVLVTGGSNGIGLGVASAFQAAGAEVTITGTRESAAAYEHDLAGLDYRQANAFDDDAIDALAASLDRLDVLVNNAGTSLMAEDEWKPETFARALQLHLVSSFRLAVGCKEKLAASVIEGGGSVLNVASMSAFMAVPVVPGYGAAKAGLVQMTKNMGTTWAPEGIRVNAVAPGLIDTNLTAPMKGFEPAVQKEMDRTPMKRWGTPEDCAPAFLFLASPAAGFITGQTLCVDGGYSAN